ncbi:putative oxidoreductase [Cladophialophora carrionii]|uniref:Putative oxidoreductase n=1 Tax=Cladophialophora carrionii TaxID=86049 RepID=A0A1C1CZ71_9EURO|nr:putative oxidoreductase [Cladophialophora carrionii]
MSPHLNWSPESLPSLEGRTYVVTGGNTGIGWWTVYHLALHGAVVYPISRSSEKGTAAVASITASIKQTKPELVPQIHLVLMDHMSLKSVVAAAKHIRSQCTSLHGIVNSAGIMATPFQLSEDGYEAQWQTNYLAHWLLTYHLLPLLTSTASTSPEGTVRVVNVSSMGHAATLKKGIDFDDPSLENHFTFRRYAQSKLANVLHAEALHARSNSSPATEGHAHIWAVALHPGNIDTQLNKRSWGGSTLVPILRCMGAYIEPEQGSFNSLWAVAGKEMTKEMSGCYFVPVGERKTPSKQARDSTLADRLWDWTEREMREKGFLEMS